MLVLGVLPALLPYFARVEDGTLRIRNGLTSARVERPARVTRQLVRFFAGRGGDWFWSDRCLAVWEAGAEDGHPVLASIRARDEDVDALGERLAAALGVRYQRDAEPSNAWSPGAARRRRGG